MEEPTLSARQERQGGSPDPVHALEQPQELQQEGPQRLASIWAPVHTYNPLPPNAVQVSRTFTKTVPRMLLLRAGPPQKQRKVWHIMWLIQPITHTFTDAGKPKTESRPREEEPAGDKNEPYVFKIERRFDFKDFDPRNWGNWVPLALALAAGYVLTHSSGQPRQISWQEFRIHYLERGEVERLEVVNRSLVRAYLRRDSAGQVNKVHIHHLHTLHSLYGIS